MGTNYEAAVDVCECCGRGRYSYHIGKSFRTLRAYKYGQGPFGASIKSFADWEIILGRPEVEIIDEYGVVQDKAGFIAEWKQHGRRKLSPDEQTYGGWIHDDRGYVLYGGEFS